MSRDRLEALRAALERSPDDAALRSLYAELLAAAGRHEDAVCEYERLDADGALPRDSLLPAVRAALATDDVTAAARFLHQAERCGVVEGIAPLRAELAERSETRGLALLAPVTGSRQTPTIAVEAEPTVTFADVGGLDEIKKTIHRTIILPFRRPELFHRYGRRAGGGVLLYGPPGVGKTLLARATAGECGLPFFNVRIEDILNMWFGNSEQNLHEAFERARASSPCVLFLDEVDALGIARSKLHGESPARGLVDQLLQELDAIGAENPGLMVLAATNAPWDVDDALKRPGRFDRVIFVPPPDEAARLVILDLLLRTRPTTDVDVGHLARRTPLFSGADLHALVERATDLAIDETLELAVETPLAPAHFDRVLRDQRPTTLAWLGTARTYIEFADAHGAYDEVERFLRERSALGRRELD